MSLIQYGATVVPVLLSALGTWFLVREVNYAHTFEELSREMAEVSDLVSLFNTDLREFWIRSAMISFKCQRQRAEEMAKSLSDEAIEEACLAYKNLYEVQGTKSIDRWYNETVKAQLKRRRTFLWLGFWLLMAGAALSIVLATAKLFNPTAGF